MSATLVHFGQDECARLMVLARAGYTVESCGTSLPKLTAQLRRGDVLAVAVTEDVPVECEKVVALTRAATKAPLILFAGVHKQCHASDFDLIIHPGVHVHEWLHWVQKMIENSRAVRAESVSTRAASTELRESSEEMREQTRKTIEKIKSGWKQE